MVHNAVCKDRWPGRTGGYSRKDAQAIPQPGLGNHYAPLDRVPGAAVTREVGLEQPPEGGHHVAYSAGISNVTDHSSALLRPIRFGWNQKPVGVCTIAAEVSLVRTPAADVLIAEFIAWPRFHS